MPHVLVLLDGQTFTGRALPKTYTVTNDDSVFKVAATKISSIVFAGANPSRMDEVMMKSTSKLRGEVSPDPLPFKPDDTEETVQFPHKKLHTLLMFGPENG